MKASLSLIFILLLFCWSGCIASAITIRLHIPVAYATDSTCNNVCAAFVDDESKILFSRGYSLRGILGFIGVGYSSSSVIWPNGISYSANAIDFSLTPVDLFTVGYGEVKGGTVSIGTSSLKPDSSSGSTMFFNFNFDFEPVKFLAGYRIWKYTHNFLGTSMSDSFKDFFKDVDYKEIGIGVGYEF